MLKYKQRMKIFRRKIITVAFGLLLGLLLIEILIRGVEFLGENKLFGLKPLRTTLIWIEDDQIGKFLLPPSSKGWFVSPTKEYYNFVHTNSAGFYDHEHQINKQTNTYRILFLGDSFTASLQTPFEETFFRKLEQRLNNQGFKKKIEIITIGLGDTGTAEQYLALKTLGMKYNPDLVIQMFLTANDFKNNSAKLQNDPYRPYFSINSNGDLEEIPHLKRNHKKFYKIKEFFKKLRLIEFILFTRQNLQEKILNSSQDYPIDYHIYDEYYNKNFSESVLVTEKLILYTRNLAEQQNSKYILTVLANNEQINNRVWNQIENTYPHVKNSKINLEKPDAIMRVICQNNNLNCFYMLPYFKNFIQSNKNTETHYFYDGHWNQTGTNLATDFLFENLLIYLKNNEPNLY